MYYTYVLYSEDFDKIYVGYTSDLEGRIISHNHPGSKAWTKRYQPWVLIHYEEYEQLQDATKRERQLKSYQGRRYIREKLIPSGEPKE